MEHVFITAILACSGYLSIAILIYLNTGYLFICSYETYIGGVCPYFYEVPIVWYLPRQGLSTFSDKMYPFILVLL